MTTRFLTAATRSLTLALLFGAACASATPVMDMRLDDLLPMGAELKKSLNLNANQAILWQQTEARMRAIARERTARRERLQQAARTGLETPQVELRELVGGLDAETSASAAEEKQLRELWLTVNDALDETQRHAVAVFLGEQLMRVADAGAPHAAPRGKDEEGGHKRGGGHGNHAGGAGGMPGGGQ